MNINLGDVKPVFSHEIILLTSLRSKKSKRGAVKKEIFPELIFIDSATKQAVARVVFPLSVLEDLSEIIKEKIKSIHKELRSKEMPKQQKIETKTTNSSYLG